MFQITLQNRGVTNLLRNCDKRTRSTFFASNCGWGAWHWLCHFLWRREWVSLQPLTHFSPVADMGGERTPWHKLRYRHQADRTCGRSNSRKLLCPSPVHCCKKIWFVRLTLCRLVAQQILNVP